MKDRVELVNADVIEYESRLDEDTFDACIWSETVYYIGARLSLNDIYEFLSRMVQRFA
jgi:hypothetical protein